MGKMLAGLLGILVSGPVLSVLSSMALIVLVLAACTAIVVCGVPLGMISGAFQPTPTPTPDIQPTRLAPTAIAAQPLPANVLSVDPAEGRTYLRLAPDGSSLLAWEPGQAGLVWIDLAAGASHLVLPDVPLGDAAWLTDRLTLASGHDFNRHWLVEAARPQPLETYFPSDAGTGDIQTWLGQASAVYGYGAYTLVVGPNVLIKDLAWDGVPALAHDERATRVPYTGLGQRIAAWEPGQAYPAPNGRATASLHNGRRLLAIDDPSGRAVAHTSAGDYYPSSQTDCTLLPFGWRYDSAGVLYRVSCGVSYRPLWSPVLMLPAGGGG